MLRLILLLFFVPGGLLADEEKISDDSKGASKQASSLVIRGVGQARRLNPVEEELCGAMSRDALNEVASLSSGRTSQGAPVSKEVQLENQKLEHSIMHVADDAWKNWEVVPKDKLALLWYGGIWAEGIDEWFTDKEGKYLFFVRTNASGCLTNILRMYYRNPAGLYVRRGTFVITSRLAQWNPSKTIFDDDGFTVIVENEKLNIRATHKFLFDQKEKQRFSIFTDHEIK